LTIAARAATVERATSSAARGGCCIAAIGLIETPALGGITRRTTDGIQATIQINYSLIPVILTCARTFDLVLVRDFAAHTMEIGCTTVSLCVRKELTIAARAATVECATSSAASGGCCIAAFGLIETPALGVITRYTTDSIQTTIQIHYGLISVILTCARVLDRVLVFISCNLGSRRVIFNLNELVLNFHGVLKKGNAFAICHGSGKHGKRNW